MPGSIEAEDIRDGGDGAESWVKVKGGLVRQRATHIMDALDHGAATGFSFWPRCQRT